MPIKQDNRSLAIKTALGPDVLAVRSIAVQEQISRLFQIEAELSSEDGAVKFDEVIGKAVTIRMDAGPKDKRYFSGIVSRLVQVANQGGHAHYRATIVPWLWLLTRTSDCRIFLDKTVPEIIQEVLNDHDLKDFQNKITCTYEKKEFCVQYRETDFNFISRLMEQEGIYYYFDHKDGKHTMVLADAISAHKPYKGYEEIIFHELEKGAASREAITDWTMEKEVQPVAYAMTDFDFKKPKTSLLKSSNVKRDYGLAQTEIYDYPGEYVEHDDGDRLADVRLNELQSQYEILQGQASARGIVVGCTFKLKNHVRSEQNREYLVTGTTLHVDAGEFATEGASGDGEFFSCNFTAIDNKQQFRPARLTPKPIVQGPQTAIVVGPGGEEIYTDEHGRVKVHFHWDRYDNHDENSSCWIRVSQYWAGKEWGSIHIPRIGQEVIIEFLEGDPDRPIITGRVYNGEQVPPYGLPANKTQSGVKSRSTKGGSGSNFNELRFEDKKGGEEVFLHGEKDWTIKIKNNENETVGASISTNAGGSISRNAGADISRTADDNITDKAGKNITTNSGKNMSLSAGGSYQLHTNLGIHLKAMNFMAALIESGAKDAAAAVKKGGGQTAAEAAAGGGAGAALAGAQNTGAAALAALSPAIAGGAAELSALSAQAGENASGVETAGSKASEAASNFKSALESGASAAVVAGAFMAMAGAAADAVESAKKLVEGLLPQIPNIELWAMKDVNAHALWSMTLSTKVKEINIQAQNKDVNVQAKQNVSIEAKTKDINIKAGKKLTMEAGDEISIKTGDAKIIMKKDGSISIEGKDITLKGSGKIGVKADSDVTIKGSKIAAN